MLNCDCYVAIFETVCVQKRSQARLKIITDTMCWQITYVFDIFV